MRMTVSTLVMTGLLGVVTAPTVTGQPRQATSVSLDAPVVTHHSGTFGGTTISYDAVVECIGVKDASNHPIARLVAMSYLASGVDAGSRPVLFAFNGGPITSSALVHFGAFGPRRLSVPDDVRADPATFKIVDNVYSPLDVADLVFFDPANTGYSRTLDGVDPKSQFSVEADGYQLAEFVIEWCVKHGRTASPKYLIGESYGTIRAVQAANQLQRLSMPVQGIVLMGQAVNIVEYCQRSGNVISHVVSLPTLAAIAWSHDRAERKGRTFEQFIEQVRTFARGEYLSVLFLGNGASVAQRRDVSRRLHEFTGISEAYFLDHDLKITKLQFARALIPGRILAVNDARYMGPVDKGDPFAPVLAAYAMAFQSYLHGELSVGDIGEYLSGSPVTGGLDGWGWGGGSSPFSDWPYANLVNEVMEKNATFRVLVANGYQDTQTTVGAMEYLAAQVRWPKNRVKTVCYHGGHMFYSVEHSLSDFSQELHRFIQAPHPAGHGGE